MDKPRKPGTSGTRFTPTRKELYLSELRRTGLKPAARLVVNISQRCVARHRTKDLDFAEAELFALTAHKLAIEEEIKRRGMEGWAEPTTIAGKKESIRRYSDRLLLEYARRHIPEFRQNVKIDQTTTHGGVVAVGLEDLSKLPREGRDLLRKLLECPIEEDDDGVCESGDSES